MNKINIAELLKDCPKGMELDCLVFEDVTLYKIDTDIENEFPIRIKTKNDYFLDLTKYGTYSNVEEAKCVIFPKGKTTWKGFVPPCKFKDGDIIFTHTNTSKGLLEYSWISIFKEYRNNRCACYVCLCLSDLKLDYDKWEDMLLCELCEIEESRLATEEEKRKLFDAIKENGCYWNAETKTLEKLPKFEDGDILTTDLGSVFILKEPNEDVLCYSCYVALNDVSRFITSYTKFCNKNGCRLATEEEKQKLFDAIKANGYKWNAETKTLEELITPRFKVGDRVKYRSGEIVYRIVQITEDSYVFDNLSSIPISIEHMYNLVPNKFDIATLKPFDKVLVRDTKKQVWVADLFSHSVNRPLGGYTFACVGHYPSQCIPYEGNEHLLGTTDDCDDFYKTWEE